jgi:hypothetical protein
MSVHQRTPASHSAELARGALTIVSILAFVAIVVVVSALLGSALGSGS